MKRTLKLYDSLLTPLSEEELMIRGGNPVAVAIGAYVGICALAYYIGYGAHYAYNLISK